MEVGRKHTTDREPAARGAQLRLLNGDDPRELPIPWRLDPATRERGLDGVRRAREALDSTHPPEQRLPRAS